MAALFRDAATVQSIAATPLALFRFRIAPRVGVSRQPWALCRNPVGILILADGLQTKDYCQPTESFHLSPHSLCHHNPRMEPAPILAAVLVLIFAGASFFFSLAETALFSLSKWQVRQLAEQDPRRGGMVTQL